MRQQGQTDENLSIAVLCLLFELGRSGSGILAQLLAQTYSTKAELIAAASRGKRPISVGAMNVQLSLLRKKLARHNIQIGTIPTLGHGLSQGARAKIRKMVAEFDEDIAGAGKRRDAGQNSKFEAA